MLSQLFSYYSNHIEEMPGRIYPDDMGKGREHIDGCLRLYRRDDRPVCRIHLSDIDDSKYMADLLIGEKNKKKGRWECITVKTLLRK